MNQANNPRPVPTPCIVESGIIVNKQDMLHLLRNIGQVHYIHLIDNQIVNEGDSLIKEVFEDDQRSTIVTSQIIYLNLHSFDYLQLEKTTTGESCFNLIQSDRQLKLIPLTTQLSTSGKTNLDAATLEAMLNQVLSAKWDVQLDDDEYSF